MKRDEHTLQSREEEREHELREPYVPPRVSYTRIEAQEALMGICKAPATPCMLIKAGGS